LTNPYESPIDCSPDERVSVSSVLRVLAILSLACGFSAFMARYGYIGWMTSQWIFVYLPVLGATSVLCGGACLVFPFSPSSRKTFAWLPAMACLLSVISCFLTAAALNQISPLAVWALPPRILLWCFTLIAALLATRQSHGTLRGRRVAAIGFAFGILQTITSIVDTMYTEYAT